MNLQERFDQFHSKEAKVLQENVLKPNLAFEIKVASWAMSLRQYAVYRYEFVATPNMSYDHEGDSSGIIWTIATGTHWQLKVQAVPSYNGEYLEHISAELESKLTAFRDSNTDVLVDNYREFEKSEEIADAILDTFDGHSVAGWWPKERQTYARWLANGKPNWPRGNPLEWKPTKSK